MLREKVGEALKDAMRAKNAVALSTIRMINVRIPAKPAPSVRNI